MCYSDPSGALRRREKSFGRPLLAGWLPLWLTRKQKARLRRWRKGYQMTARWLKRKVNWLDVVIELDTAEGLFYLN